MKLMIPHDTEGREAFIRRAKAEAGRSFDFLVWLRYAAPKLRKSNPGKKIWDQVRVDKLEGDALDARWNEEDNPYKRS